MKLKLFISLTLLIFINTAAYAQVSKHDVLLSGDYMFGQAYGETRAEAINNARVSLIEKLVVTVSNEAELEVRDEGDVYESQFLSRTQTLSRMRLRGLDVITEERRDQSWEAIAFISNEDYRKSMDSARERLIRLLQTAEEARNTSAAPQALQDYAEVMVERSFFPLPIYADEAVSNATGNDIADFAARRIERMLSDIEIEITEIESYTDPVELVLELRLTHPTEDGPVPVQDTEIRFDLSGYGFMPVKGGFVELSLDVLPERTKATYTLELRPFFNPPDDSYAAIAASTLPRVTRRLEIDFTPYIDLDFSARQIGTGGFLFQAFIQNLAVSNVKWDFGDGLHSNRLNPRQAFTPEQMEEPRLITLEINGRENLRVIKELHPDGSLKAPDFSNQESEEETRVDAAIIPDSGAASTVEAFTVPSGHQQLVDGLIRAQRWEQARQLLSGYKLEAERLQFGNRDAVGTENTALSYMLIVEPETMRIEAVLSPELDGSRQNLRSGSVVGDIREQYRGHAPVWVYIP
jgi:hypothetical protein